ncbi:MAG: DegV family protein [Chloroflexota bacterium]|nr:DegV family protein [Chloroflexota bacterium]
MPKSKIALVTDSTAYLSPEKVQECNTTVIPLYIHLDEATYRDGVDLDADTFFQKLKGAPELPTTSQPSVGDFLELYRRLSRENDAIISIHISSGISGTVSAAQMARQTLLDELAELPEIYVIDSQIASCGLALLVTAAARAIAQGWPAKQVAQHSEELAARIRTLFAVDTLEYLHKGGRINGAAALFGSALQIKPILYFREGKIEPLEKVRTSKRVKQRILEIMGEQIQDQPVHICIVHAQVREEAERVRAYCAARFDCREIFIEEISPVISTHVGPGTVAVSFYTVKS